MAEFLDFKQISQQITFRQVLNWLSIPYTEKKGELKGKLGEDSFIANIEKNFFFCPKNDITKGGVINFVSHCLNLSLRDAALALKVQFLPESTQPKRELPNLELHYCKYLEKLGITEDTAREHEVGLVKQKSIINGKIAFKIYDHQGLHTGYVGFNPDKQDWFFPKGFKRPLYRFYVYKDVKHIFLTTDPFSALLLAQQGKPCCSLLGKSMTDDQEEVLRLFSVITLLHPEPENIVNRLCHFTFIKAPKYSSLINSVEEIV